MKYIDAEKLEKFKETLADIIVSSQGICTYRDCKEIAEREALLLIATLQHEQPEVDGEFFFDEVLKVYDDNNKYPPRSEEELTMLETVARHFYNLGKNSK